MEDAEAGRMDKERIPSGGTVPDADNPDADNPDAAWRGRNVLLKRRPRNRYQHECLMLRVETRQGCQSADRRTVIR